MDNLRNIIIVNLKVNYMTQALSPSDLISTQFEALAHPKRRAILTTLSFRPATVGQLAEEHQLSLPAIHKHIRMLEKAALILRKKVGRTNAVVLRRSGVKQVQDWLKEFNTHWGSDQETLENYSASLQSSQSIK